MKKFVYAFIAAALLLVSGTSNYAAANNQVIDGDFTMESDDIYSAYVEGTGFKIDPSIDVTTTENISVIVEFNALAPVMASEYSTRGARVHSAGEIEEMHNNFESFVMDRNGYKTRNSSNETSTWELGFQYDTVFVGVSMTLPGIEIEELAKAEEVLRIWPDEVIEIDPIVETGSNTDARSVKPNTRMINTVPALGVDKLHADGITGAGIKVGVLDTGIDYNHPDLASAYKGYKFVSDEDLASQTYETTLGWDFIDDDADPMETTYADYVAANEIEPTMPDINGKTFWTSHGTHVSGTIAGNAENTSSEYATLGVAPGASLYGYRVLGRFGSGTTAATVAGIEKSVEDGMDIINLSLGNGYSHDLFPTSLALNNAALAGTVPVVAAGNSGPTFNTVGSPGSSALAITVGASNLDRTYSVTDATVGSETATVKYFADNLNGDLKSFEGTTQEVVYAGLGEPIDFISRGAVDINNPTFDGKIALIERGTISFYSKLMNAKAYGAIGVIIYNNVDGEIEFYLPLSTDYIPVFKTTQAEGEALFSQLTESIFPTNGMSIYSGEITFGTMTDETEERNDLAALSSVGPIISSGEIKPDVVAPGVDILSAYPADVIAQATSDDYSQAYAQIQGTSMATPHVAGLVALMLEHDSSLTPEQIKVIVTNTADPLNDEYSVFQTGGGRIDPAGAVYSDYAITVENNYRTYNEDLVIVEEEYNSGVMNFGIAYNDGSDVTKTSKIKLDNYNSASVDLSLSVEYTDPSINEMIQDASANGVSLTLSSNNLTSEVTATMKLPASATDGLYEGRIVVTNGNDSTDTRYIPFAIYKKEGGIYSVDVFPPVLSAMCMDQAVGGSRLALDFGQPLNSITIYYIKDGERVGLMNYVDYSAVPVLATGPIELFNGLQSSVISNYREFDDSEDGLADYYNVMDAGEAIIEIEAEFEGGAVDSIYHTVLVSEEQPTFEVLDGADGLYEYENSEFGSFFNPKTVEVNYRVEEPNLDWLIENVDHSIYSAEYDNKRNFVSIMAIQYGIASPYSDIFVGDDDGVITIGFERVDANQGVTYLMNAFSRFSLCNTKEYETAIAFTPANGSQMYGRLLLDKEEYGPDEDVVATYQVYNADQAIGFSGKRIYIGESRGMHNTHSVKEYDFTNEFKAHQEENGVEYVISEVTDISGYSTGFDISLADPDNIPVGYTGVSGDMPLLEITYNGKGSTSITADDSVAAVAAMVYSQKFGETSSKAHHYYGVDISKRETDNAFSVLIPTPQAFLKMNNGSREFHYPTVDDFTDFGIKMTYLAVDGEKTVVMENYAERTFDLKATGELNSIYFEVPGHTTEVVRNRTGMLENGRVIGAENATQGVRLYTENDYYGSFAGDVNSDEVVDIHDLESIYLASKLGTRNLTAVESDINQDGVVDKTDIDYIIANMGKAGTIAEIAPKTVLDKYKDMHYFMNMLGYEYENFNGRTYANLFADDNLVLAILDELGVSKDDVIDYTLLDGITSIDSNTNSLYEMVSSLGGINMLKNLETITLQNSKLDEINVDEEFANLAITKVDLSGSNLTSITGSKLENLTTLNLSNTNLTEVLDYFGLYEELELDIDGNQITDFTKLGELNYLVNTGVQYPEINIEISYNEEYGENQYYEFEIPTIKNSKGEEIDYESTLTVPTTRTVGADNCSITGNKAKCSVDLEVTKFNLIFSFEDEASTTGSTGVSFSVNTTYSTVEPGLDGDLTEAGNQQFMVVMLVALLAMFGVRKFQVKYLTK